MKRILIISRDPALDFRQLKDHSGISLDGEFQFFINDFNCQPDYVVVNGKGLREPHEFQVPKQQTVLLTNEPHSVLEYPRGYYRQFGSVCSCQEQIKRTDDCQVHYTQAAIPWYVGVVFNADNTCRFTMNYEQIEQAQPKKEKLISIITSNKAFSAGHVDRLRFVRKLTDRYGQMVDVFGHGFKNFDDKWDVLAPYRYHIVIENSRSTHYWSEKLTDCYLAETFPLYHGSPNIGRFFPEEAFTPIDINQPEEAFAAICQAIEQKRYEQSREVLAECKQLVMQKYNMFTLIADVCRNIQPTDNGDSTLILPASKFFSIHNWYLYTFGRTFYKMKARLFTQTYHQPDNKK